MNERALITPMIIGEEVRFQYGILTGVEREQLPSYKIHVDHNGYEITFLGETELLDIPTEDLRLNIDEFSAKYVQPFVKKLAHLNAAKHKALRLECEPMP